MKKKILYAFLCWLMYTAAYSQDTPPVGATVISPNFTWYKKIVDGDTSYYAYSNNNWVNFARRGWVKKTLKDSLAIRANLNTNNVFNGKTYFGNAVSMLLFNGTLAGHVGYDATGKLIKDTVAYAKLNGGNLWNGPQYVSGQVGAQTFVTSSYGGALIPGDISGGNFIASASNNGPFLGLTTKRSGMPTYRSGERPGGGAFVVQKWNGSAWADVLVAGVGDSTYVTKPYVDSAFATKVNKNGGNTFTGQQDFQNGIAFNGTATVQSLMNISASASINFRYGSGYVQGAFIQSIDGGNLKFNRTGFVTSGGTPETDNTYSFRADGIYYNNARTLTSLDSAAYAKLSVGNTFNGDQYVDGYIIGIGSGNNVYNINSNPYFGNVGLSSDGAVDGNRVSAIIFNRQDPDARILRYHPAFYGDNRLHFGSNPVDISTMQSVAYVSDITTATGNYLPLSGGTLTGDLILASATPTNALSATPKAYIDNLITGITWKNAVRVKTTANITLTGTQTIDGIALAVGNRILVNNQTTASQNGIYQISTGAWTRVTDADESAEIQTATVAVTAGTVNKNTQWTYVGIQDLVIGTDAIQFGQISGAGTYTNGTYLTLSGNVFDANLPAFDGRYAKLAEGNIWTGNQQFGLGTISGGTGPTAYQLGTANSQFGYFKSISDGNGGSSSTALVFNTDVSGEKTLKYSPSFYGDGRLHWGTDALAYQSDITTAGAAYAKLNVGNTFNGDQIVNGGGISINGSFVLKSPAGSQSTINQQTDELWISDGVGITSIKNGRLNLRDGSGVLFPYALQSDVTTAGTGYAKLTGGNSITGAQSIIIPNVGTSISTDAFSLSSSITTSTVTQNHSPLFRLSSNEWNTTTSANDRSDYAWGVRGTTGATTQGTMFLSYQHAGGGYTDLVSFLPNGRMSVSALGNMATGNNALLSLNSTGLIASRNINDANTAFTVNQAQGTGNILNLQFGGSNKFFVDPLGNITANYKLAINANALQGSMFAIGSLNTFTTTITPVNTNGYGITQQAQTYISSTASGTYTTGAINSYGVGVFSAPSATTITKAYGNYFASPAGSANVTLTNSYALGTSGDIEIGGSFLAAGRSSVGKTTAAGGVLDVDASSGFSTANPFSSLGFGFRVGASGVTYTSNAVAGTQTFGSTASISGGTFAALNATTITNASTLYIASAPIPGTNVTITNPYALYINSGSSYLQNVIAAGSLTQNTPNTYSSGGIAHLGRNITTGRFETMPDMIAFNATTSSLSSATLISTYPTAPLGFQVICGNISAGGAIYTKYSSSVWLMSSAPVQP